MFLSDSRTPWLYQRSFTSFVCCLRRKEWFFSPTISSSTLFFQTPISKKSNSAQNYLVTITLVLFVQIKWFLSLNWNSKRELSPRLESPHLELCSLSYSHFYISVQSPLNLHFYHLIHPFYAKIHLIKSQEISHYPTLEFCQFPILFLFNFLNFPTRFNPRRS